MEPLFSFPFTQNPSVLVSVFDESRMRTGPNESDVDGTVLPVVKGRVRVSRVTR